MQARALTSDGSQIEGRLTRMVGFTLEAQGCMAAIGSRCQVEVRGGQMIDAEVVGFEQEKLYLMALGHPQGLQPGARVVPVSGAERVAVGNALLGRVIDFQGLPLDGKGAIRTRNRVPIGGRFINPLQRFPVAEVLDVGVRSINSLLTVGSGQRLGLFAAAGAGKSVLLGMMTKFASADVVVIGLIGERGREVQEFVASLKQNNALDNAVVVAAPADVSPVGRLRAAQRATAIAEYFRDAGQRVLLLMDSLTRFCQAQREIALAIGEPPASKGYPPSTFARLGQLLERAGNGDRASGSITAIYTVLTEGEETTDPVAEAARAVLDGHIVLSREFAEAGHYPAIDIEASISRVMTGVTDAGHQQLALEFKRMFSLYRRNADLIRVGAYTPGQDPELDQAVTMYPRMMEFLRQQMDQGEDYGASLQQLTELLTPATTVEPSAGDSSSPIDSISADSDR
ncbi:MAG: FliI/YscN family ATPase [Gammaproteobacteria bacterium]